VVDGKVRAGSHADHGRYAGDKGEKRPHCLLALNRVIH
jgi:hypothetical protein